MKYQPMATIKNMGHFKPFFLPEEKKILLPIFIFFAIGIIFFFSVQLQNYNSNPEFNFLAHFLPQVQYSILGVIIILCIRFIPIYLYRDFSWLLFLGATFLTLLVFVPGIGIESDAKRWIDIGIGTIQPSEFLKVAGVLFVASIFSFFSVGKENVVTIRQLVIAIIPALVVGFIAAAQPNYSLGILFFVATAVIVLLAPLSKKFFITLSVLAIIVGMVALYTPYVNTRITDYKDRLFNTQELGEEYYQGSGYQPHQAIITIASGGLLGKGYTQRAEHTSFFPAIETDYIFIVISQELGFIGGAGFIGLVIYFIITAYTIAARRKKIFHTLLISGLLTLIVAQFLLNLGVVTSILPVTGVPLPFISKGGSSILALSIAVGIICSALREKEV